MRAFRQDEDTICALSTPAGHGGIGVIRVSGPKALEFGRQLARFVPEQAESHRVYFGKLRRPEDSSVIDEVVVAYFGEGRSFTGQETLELSIHGSPYIVREVLRNLQLVGCRMAEPGEFTYRAFMLGRLDLVQAESVLQLIQSESENSARVALRQLQGGLSDILNSIEDELIWVLAHLEANIDFAQEDIVVAEIDVLVTRVQRVSKRVSELLSSYKRGRIVREGLEVALVGAPNVGKSSLLNAFGGEDRAIVAPIPGTTRDRVDIKRVFNGLVVNFMDTAGLRVTEDPVERLGIEKTLELLPRADWLFWVVDGPQVWADKGFSEEGMWPLVENKGTGVCVLVNKIDLLNQGQREQVLGWVKEFLQRQGLELAQERIFLVSATSGEGLKSVESFLGSIVGESFLENSAAITQARHFELLTRTLKGLESGLAQLVDTAASPEFVVFELQEALFSLQEILGKRFDDQVMDRVFKEFCLGK